jgi:hypothetical protein
MRKKLIKSEKSLKTSGVNSSTIKGSINPEPVSVIAEHVVEKLMQPLDA